MGKFNRDGQRSGGDFNRGGFGGGKPAMHKAICSECGASCELPFRPTGDRPVFCSECFKKHDSGGERRERPRFENKQMFDAVCAKCGKKCQVPFRPMPGKTVFCDDCFGKGGNKDSGEVIEQIKMLNGKIDKLIKILAPNAVIEKTEKPEIKREVVIKKTVPAKQEKKKIKITPKKAVVKKKK